MLTETLNMAQNLAQNKDTPLPSGLPLIGSTKKDPEALLTTKEKEQRVKTQALVYLRKYPVHR